jgi:hypothetical protein
MVPPDAGAGLEHGHRAQHVGAQVEQRVAHRDPHVHLRGEVVYQVGSGGGDDALQPVRGDVRAYEGEGTGPLQVDRTCRSEVAQAAGRQVIDHRDDVAARKHPLHQPGSDEAGSPGHERAHGAHCKHPGP